jgi:PPOX class probable F420-dependent enzyme
VARPSRPRLSRPHGRAAVAEPDTVDEELDERVFDRQGDPRSVGGHTGTVASLSDDRVRSFLLEGTRTGKIAWVASDGAPHVAPIWFVLDGDDVVFNTGAGTGKGRALAREGRASLVVDDDAPPFSFVKIDGTVTLHDDLDEVRRRSRSSPASISSAPHGRHRTWPTTYQ